MSSATQAVERDAERMTRKAANAADNESRSVRDMAEHAGQSVREFIHDKSEKANDLQKHTAQKISENPMRSVALATLGGVVLGMLLRR